MTSLWHNDLARRGLAILILAVTVASPVRATPPEIPIREIKDTARYFHLIQKTRTHSYIQPWEWIRLNYCWYRLSTPTTGVQARDSTAELSLIYLLPTSLLRNGTRYEVELKFLFRKESCINDDSLLAFCNALPSMIEGAETSKEVSLFLQLTRPDVVAITYPMIKWSSQRDTLISWLSPDLCDQHFFSFRSPNILTHYKKYLGRWNYPQTEEFTRNTTMRYASLMGDRMWVSSGPGVYGDFEYFVSFEGVSVDNFRLRNGKGWQSFAELTAADSLARGFLSSNGFAACTFDTSVVTGYAVKPFRPNRGCTACGDTIYISYRCASSDEPVVVGVQLIDNLRPGFVGFVDTSKVRGWLEDPQRSKR